MKARKNTEVSVTIIPLQEAQSRCQMRVAKAPQVGMAEDSRTCRYLRTRDGQECVCLKNTLPGTIVDKTMEAGQAVFRGNHCSGYPHFVVTNQVATRQEAVFA